jgi:hypothetical protein
MMYVCGGVQSEPIRELCLDLGVEDATLLSGAEINANYMVFINGLIVGCEDTTQYMHTSFGAQSSRTLCTLPSRVGALYAFILSSGAPCCLESL